jgi:hypothetical protein
MLDVPQSRNRLKPGFFATGIGADRQKVRALRTWARAVQHSCSVDNFFFRFLFLFLFLFRFIVKSKKRKKIFHGKSSSFS